MSNWVSVLILLRLGWRKMDTFHSHKCIILFFPFYHRSRSSFSLFRLSHFYFSAMHKHNTLDTRHVHEENIYELRDHSLLDTSQQERNVLGLSPLKFFRTFIRAKMSTLIFYLFVFDVEHFILFYFFVVRVFLLTFLTLRFALIGTVSIFQICYN